MRIKSIEEAHRLLTEYCLAFVNDRRWDKIEVNFKIFSTMATAKQKFIFEEESISQGGFENNPDSIWGGLDAALFIRNYNLNRGCKRIWGLTFTLYPDGKFEIEYDYNKPEDYEETDEVITGEEINQTFLK